MSLGATHIRFALDLQARLGAKDLHKYLSGAIYPDSRYVSGIDWKQTHDDKILAPDFATDDFKKGWQAHFICDAMFNRKRKEFFPELFDEPGDHSWITASTMKIIQDMSDAQAFSIQEYLSYLDHVETPFGEDPEALKRSSQIIFALYGAKTKTSVEDYIKMFAGLGVGADRLAALKAKTEEFLQDENLVKRIQSLYGEMIGHYQELLPS